MAPLLIGALLLAAASAAPHALATYPAAFSEEEVRAIVALFASSEPTRDAREDDQVARTNRWLPRKALADGTVDWIAERVLEKHGAAAWGGVDARALLATRVEFVLLHEFGEGDYFGWHVDVEPGDPEGLRRYLNVNVLLSAPDRAGVETTVGGDFGGGHLEVGGSNASLAPGSLYVYPAPLPHRVGPVTRGTRLSLVIATSFPGPAPASFWDDAAYAHEALCEADDIMAAHLHAACARVPDGWKAGLVGRLATKAKNLAAVRGPGGEIAPRACRDAAAALVAAAILHPGDPAIPANRARVHLQLGDLAGAEEAADRALDVAVRGSAPKNIADQVRGLRDFVAGARAEAAKAGEL